ncbi:MAG: diguanylate cyclase domain-containing protein, partial [Allosphingosinicella sp.]
MYHAPVPLDIDPSEAEPAEVADNGAGVGVDAGSRKLTEAHLHHGQVQARALFAPFLTATSLGSALLVAWALFADTNPVLIAGWLAAVGGANFINFRFAMQERDAAGSRSAERRSPVRAIGEAVVLSGVWASLPTLAFSSQGHGVQVVMVAAMAAMIIAAIAFAAVPAAAYAWIATVTAALCCAFWLGTGLLNPMMIVTIVGVAAVAIAGMARLTRWTFEQLQTIAKVRTQAESIRLLLKEYEHRGVGWLWQVDAENRVVYISSRMTALLGRSASQLIGHSLPATLGGNSALGRTLLDRQPFANLEMELKTRRGARWISLAGDPIIDMAGQFQGFRGVGSDITEVRRTQERLTNLANMDVLSGLPNRGRVRQLLGEALTAAQSGNVPCAIMFLDLDGFKPVNDTFGHPKGDAVLKSV